jgi:hypothetical protein
VKSWVYQAQVAYAGNTTVIQVNQFVSFPKETISEPFLALSLHTHGEQIEIKARRFRKPTD